MLTPSPCYDIQTRTDCPRRCVGCRDTCLEWAEWTILHDAELEKKRRIKKAQVEADAFEMGRRDRDRRMYNEQYEKRRRRKGCTAPTAGRK